MENLIMKNIFENSAKINGLTKYVKKVYKKCAWGFIFTAVALWSTNELVKQHDEEINNLKKEIEEMKSKGE